MSKVRTNQRSLLDLYLAFVRTWILEYQLHSMAPVGGGPLDWTTSDREPGKSRRSEIPPKHSKARAAALDNEDFIHFLEPRMGGRATRPSQPSGQVPHRPIPFLEPVAASRSLDPQVPTKIRIPSVDLPRVVRSILRDCEEHWRHLALALQARSETHGLRTLLVTGAHPGEGYTTVSLALSVALAEFAGSRVLLMDGDFAHPSIARTLGIHPKLALDHVLLDDVPVERAILECEDPNLAILPLMEAFEFPSMTAGGRRLQQAMGTLREAYDLVVVDGGCRHRDGTSLPLMPGLDAALLVCHRATTTDEELDRIDEKLLAHQISCLGVIENEP